LYLHVNIAKLDSKYIKFLQVYYICYTVNSPEHKFGFLSLSDMQM